MNDNPFNPAFGKIPPIFIDREDYVREIVEGISSFNSPMQTTLISGVRGVGKTVLLADICRELEADPKWIVADIPSNGNILEILVQSVREKASTELRRAIDSIEGISISLLGVGISYSADKPSVNYQLLLEKILRKLKEKHISLLVAIDEVEANTELRRFASIYQIMVRKDYPIALLMTGLPKNISELQNDKTLTFLLRSARIELPLLSQITVQYSYREVFSSAGKNISLPVLKRLTSLTLGYSYAFQLLGYLIWNKNTTKISDAVVDSCLEKYKELLYRNVYSKIYEELSLMDRKFILAMAACSETVVPMKFISDTLSKKANYVSTYKRRLIDSGVIQAESYGNVVFCLPLFKDYLIEFHME